MTEVEFLPLFDRWNGMVYALALSVTRSPQDAEDISQEVFLTLLERPPAPGKERAWLARVTVNRCRDLLRSPWRRRREDLDQADRELAFSQPEEGVLYEALGALEPEVRALLHLRFYEGFGVAELARQFHTTPPALSARLYRAKRQLRRRMEELSDETALS
ncbi:MAG TPA: sigma-70 family RNA polymerase sigma factor [Candidatus Intestinimonas pullistercoris]|mgnify:CR=1 FL=1|uniref:Sigma-70 family RNA polymerase sigma factor n=1 Tax=Candidatus Intestinimonas pullistercoris TaxID=2838623 RepID=A0A9D2P155_9FIRM|nr:sigma-70 family RNA polymerase sigma factor [uncultured Intestinimonas sp.]HJC41692.1 sigma-70 family RNA polymerase sigma factor [Candidatus Intestinimonas pullistercoris]